MAPMTNERNSPPRTSLTPRSAPALGASEAYRLCMESIFDDEMAGLFDCSQRARYRVLEASKAIVGEALKAKEAAETALTAAQTMLQAERERARATAAAADRAAVEAAAKIGSLKDRVIVQAATITGLEERWQVQVARSERLGARAARVATLETRIAQDAALEVKKPDAARRATEAEAARGRAEGFHLGFHRALAKICGKYPELRADAAKFSVQEAMAEMEAEAAAELRTRLQPTSMKRGRTSSQAGSSSLP